jgi:hypothetical protein
MAVASEERWKTAVPRAWFWCRKNVLCGASMNFIRHASCDASGHFEISNMRPGEYYAYAFDQQPPIKDVAELLGNRAVRVTVRSGEFSGAALRVMRLP